MTYELFEQGPAAYIPWLLISLVVTVSAYGAFPLLFAISRRARITAGKYRCLCYVVNIAILLCFWIINGGVTNGAPYLLWTSIWTMWGVKILDSRGKIKTANDFPDNTSSISEHAPCEYQDKNAVNACSEYDAPAERYVRQNEDVTIEKNDKICFCRKCGAKLADDGKFCHKCGTEVIEVRRMHTLDL